MLRGDGIYRILMDLYNDEHLPEAVWIHKAHESLEDIRIRHQVKVCHELRIPQKTWV